MRGYTVVTHLGTQGGWRSEGEIWSAGRTGSPQHWAPGWEGMAILKITPSGGFLFCNYIIVILPDVVCDELVGYGQAVVVGRGLLAEP